jgi:hypothetical protein
LAKLAAKDKAAAFSFLALRGLIIIIGCLGLAWAVPDLAVSAVSDDFRDLEARLLQFESVKPETAARLLRSAADKALSPCDMHAQRALQLMEVRLADIELRSGAAQDFDRHMTAIRYRSKQMLSCTPRDSLAWLLLFGLEIEYGNLTANAFDLLEMSYETSPNEGWLGLRRVTVAIPVLPAARYPLQQKILTEFEGLIRSRLIEIPAHLYSSVSEPIRVLLQSRIDGLDANTRKRFLDTAAGLRRP